MTPPVELIAGLVGGVAALVVLGLGYVLGWARRDQRAEREEDRWIEALATERAIVRDQQATIDGLLEERAEWQAAEKKTQAPPS